MNDDSEKGLLQDKVLQQTFCFLDIDLSMAVKNRLKITPYHPGIAQGGFDNSGSARTLPAAPYRAPSSF